MKMRDNLGIGYTNALDRALGDLQARYSITRADARRLLADAISRNCVWDTIIDMCDWQLRKEDAR
jgi:hypothetical protein